MSELSASLHPFLFNKEVYAINTILKQITAMIAEDKFPHNIIISGPSGRGKSLLVTKIANMLIPYPAKLKQENHLSLPHPDILWISSNFTINSYERKGSSVITISEIKKIQNFLQYKIYGNQKRLVVIDGAENLNVYSSNALLKTLEQQGKSTHIILITNRFYKLLGTIRSRCHHIHLPPFTFKDFSLFMQNEYYTNTLLNNKNIIQIIHEFSEGNLHKVQTILSFPITLQYFLNQKESHFFISSLQLLTEQILEQFNTILTKHKDIIGVLLDLIIAEWHRYIKQKVLTHKHIPLSIESEINEYESYQKLIDLSSNVHINAELLLYNITLALSDKIKE